MQAVADGQARWSRGPAGVQRLTTTQPSSAACWTLREPALPALLGRGSNTPPGQVVIGSATPAGASQRGLCRTRSRASAPGSWGSFRGRPGRPTLRQPARETGRAAAVSRLAHADEAPLVLAGQGPQERADVGALVEEADAVDLHPV